MEDKKSACMVSFQFISDRNQGNGDKRKSVRYCCVDYIKSHPELEKSRDNLTYIFD